jgi:hypothetical protein
MALLRCLRRAREKLIYEIALTKTRSSRLSIMLVAPLLLALHLIGNKSTSILKKFSDDQTTTTIQSNQSI